MDGDGKEKKEKKGLLEEWGWRIEDSFKNLEKMLGNIVIKVLLVNI